MYSEFNLPPKYLTIIQRNYVLYKSAENSGISYFRHPSGVIVMALGSDHEAKNKEIKSFCWEAQKKNHGIDRQKLSICGKNKKVLIFKTLINFILFLNIKKILINNV